MYYSFFARWLFLLHCDVVHSFHRFTDLVKYRVNAIHSPARTSDVRVISFFIANIRQVSSRGYFFFSRATRSFSSVEKTRDSAKNPSETLCRRSSDRVTKSAAHREEREIANARKLQILQIRSVDRTMFFV